MSLSALITRRSCGNAAGAALIAVALAGCAAQQKPDYYDTPHDSTQADAEKQAQGRSGARAPSQIQLGFGKDKTKPAPKQGAENAAAQEAAAVVREISEAKTFLGTVPCLTGTAGCSATRFTLTLAPAGQWRARTVSIDNADPKTNIAQQGCWSVVGTAPLRIILQLPNGNTKANLTFVNDNVLRINMINDVEPVLSHQLTRQPDIDPIDDLKGQAALQCPNVLG